MAPAGAALSGLAVSGLVAVLGAAAMVEMTYHLQLNAAMGSELDFLGRHLDAASTATWLGAGALLAVGGVALEACRRVFVRRWSTIQEHIEQQLQRTGVAA